MNYDKVPNIITGKDLDYISDMFEWNYIAYKKALHFSSMTQDEELKLAINKGSELFLNNLRQLLNILSTGGNNE